MPQTRIGLGLFLHRPARLHGTSQRRRQFRFQFGPRSQRDFILALAILTRQTRGFEIIHCCPQRGLGVIRRTRLASALNRALGPVELDTRGRCSRLQRQPRHQHQGQTKPVRRAWPPICKRVNWGKDEGRVRCHMMLVCWVQSGGPGRTG